VQRVRAERDPIDQLREKILASGLGDEAALKELDRDVKDIVTEAAEFAQNSPEPDPSELYTDILMEV
jgi:pyruvate dehydrogenase E1 component alpha subunit